MNGICLLFFLIFSFLVPNVFGNKVDSLKSELKSASNEPEKIIILKSLITEYYSLKELDSVLNYCKKGIASTEIKTDNDNKAFFLGKIARVYDLKGKYSESLSYYLKAIKVAEKYNLQNRLADLIFNTGSIYNDLGNNKNAEEMYWQSLELALERKDSSLLANLYNNLGIIYMMKWEYDTAVNFLEKSIKLKNLIGDEVGTASTLTNLAIYFGDIKEIPKAIEYFSKAEQIHKKYNNPRSKAIVQLNFGDLYSNQKQYSKATNYYNKALSSAKEAKDYRIEGKILNNMSNNYEKDDDYKNAHMYGVMSRAINDSIFSLEKQKQITEMQTKYESDKKSLEIEKLTNEKRAKNAEIAVKEEEAKRQQTQIITLVAGSLLLVFVAIMLYRQFKRKQKDHDLISVQKEKLEKQKSLVEEKNQEITDSINYAKRIQDAILPPIEVLKNHFPESFVFFKPKDVVSGDFYWMAKIPSNHTPNGGEGQILFAVADCTGHGVPGAMVSVVCNNALNRAVKEFRLSEPAKILDKVNELVDESFAASHMKVQDGMDIALVSLSLSPSEEGGMTVQYAGAHNPLWIIKQDHSCETVTADKQPIGSHSNRKPFINHIIKLEKGDTIYLFSDGYADQFGGEKGKKLKYRPFRQLLLSIQDQPLEKQGKILAQKFDEWKGNYEQVDDVSLVGIKV